MNRGSDRELRRRIEGLKQRLTEPTPAPLAGQQTLDLPRPTRPGDDEPDPGPDVQPQRPPT